MKPIIEIKDLEITRGERVILRIDSLTVKKGETLSIIGPNGAGKSTLLLALANLIKASKGQILFYGKPIDTWDDLEYRRKLSYVFQDPLLMDMSVEDNAGLGLKMRGLPKDEIKIRSHEWLKKLGVEPLSRRRANHLSGGEAQRVALARALVLNPEILLMDEPFSALDSPTRRKLTTELASLLRQEKRTTFFVTHNLSEAAKLGHRIAVVMDGTLVQVGSARQIKQKPANKNVAAFLKELPH
jgi:tungstate transport system ATP-binding protein